VRIGQILFCDPSLSEHFEMEKLPLKKKKMEKRVPIQKRASSIDPNLSLWGEEGGCFTQESTCTSSMKEQIIESKCLFHYVYLLELLRRISLFYINCVEY